MNDEQKKIQLRRHKLWATGLFVLMVIVYITTVYYQQHNADAWVGYVNAFAEAAMVGALADWFAVTALFHHPLGLPIPHTNLIERGKKSIGNNLGAFVVDNFLTNTNIRPYIEKLDIAMMAVNWLEKEPNKVLLRNESIGLIRKIVTDLDDDAVIKLLKQKGGALIEQVDLGKLLGNAAAFILQRGDHQQLITTLAESIRKFIGAHEDIVSERVKRESYFFVPGFVEDKLADKISKGLQRYFEEIATNEQHQVRAEITQNLSVLAEDIKSGKKWSLEIANIKTAMLSEEETARYAADIWSNTKQMLLTKLSNNDSTLSKYIDKTINELYYSMKNDVLLQQKINQWVRKLAYRYFLRNRERVGELISNTVGNWQGNELSQKLELEVGKDLQFIRINGTIVGGLVGCIIHAITKLVGG